MLGELLGLPEAAPMPKRVLPLTVKDIERQKPPIGKADRLLADGNGLYLRITRSGGRSWVYRYMTDGERHDLGLGPYPDIGLAEARERATAQRRLRLSGQDPISLRRTERDGKRLAKAKAMTFKDCAERYIEAHRAGWKSAKHAAQWGATLDSYVYPIMGKLPVASIDTGFVMQALEPVETSRRISVPTRSL